MQARTVLLAVALCTGTLALPSSAWAHPHLRRSNPASGGVLTTPPSKVTLVFSEPVESGLTSLIFVGAGGDSTIVSGFRSVPGAGLEIEAPLDKVLKPGRYSALWSCMGIDGHGVKGRYSFSIAEKMTVETNPAVSKDSSPAISSTVNLTAEKSPVGLDSEEMGANSGGLGGVVARIGTFTGVLLLLGASAFWFLILLRSGLSSTIENDFAGTTRRIAIVGAATLLTCTVARVFLESRIMASMRGMPMNSIHVLTDTKWGSAMELLLGAGFIAIIALFFGRRSAAGWMVAAGAGVAAAVAIAIGGHAGSAQRMSGAAVVADSVHLLAVSCWIGSLFCLTVTVLPSVLIAGDSDRWQNVASLVRAFSPVAMVSMVIIVLTGTFSTWMQLQHFSNLFGTPYGKVLLLKLGLFGVTAAIGAYNYRVVTPSLGTEAGTVRLGRSARTEVAVAVLILIVTGILTGLSVT